MRTFDISCRHCTFREAYNRPYAACPRCGAGWLDALYDYHDVRLRWPAILGERSMTMWRFHELLPVRNEQNIVTLGEGWTPLLRAQNLGLMLGHPNIYIKDERQGPTGSFKDRQAAVAITAMKEAGITEAVVASTGNVAIAYSAYGARAGIKMWIFVTSTVPPEKMREVALYGAEVVKVAGTYDQTKKIAADFADNKGIFLDRGIKGIAAKEAMKTLAFEVAEQLGNVAVGRDPNVPNPGRTPWRAPDWYLQAISGGLGPVGVMKGFSELKEMELIDNLPRLGCFQVSGCAPIADSFHKKLARAEVVDEPMTDITTLSTGDPGEAYEVLCELVNRHGGTIDAVTDAEAFRALKVVAEMDGLSVEPATAVTFAGLFNLIRQGVIRRDEIVVVNCSGHTFPVEKHIVVDHFTRDMALRTGEGEPPRAEGLLAALEVLDNRVKRVAIVEDNADAARLIRRILQAQGDFLIEEANDGRGGLRLIHEWQPNLVVLDLMMPGIDGFDIVEAMKADEQLADIPIIVVTAKELSAIEQRRLSGKIRSLWRKGSFMNADLIGDILEALPTDDDT